MREAGCLVLRFLKCPQVLPIIFFLMESFI